MTAQVSTDLTCVDVLRRRAQDTPDGRAFLYLPDGETEGPSLTYGELDAQCRALAGRLQQAGFAGERVLLLYPPGLDFIVGFLGCLYAGAIAVPLYPPDSPQAAERVAGIAADAQAVAALTTRETLALFERFPALAGLTLLAADAPHEGDAPWTPLSPAPESLAFLQYTSGSTAAPKGVMISHANIMGNQAAIHAAAKQGPDSVFLTWLPLYHDMGLMGMVVQPLYVGAPCILMPPRAFLRRPARWLKAISRYRATLSGGPNFAFDLCLSRVSLEDRQGLDLSSWQVAYNGAEPVSFETLRRFAEAYAPYGLTATSLYPCYGLAEATAFYTGGNLSGPWVTRVSSEELAAGRAEPRSEGRALVGCGQPHADHRLYIVDPATARLCPPGQVGEIWLAGASVAMGYWNRPEATSETFAATLADRPESPCLRTGDLGFVQGGQLVVCGRLKDVVIIRGRNHYPQDLEATVRACHPALAVGEGAAFTVMRDGEERLCLVHEVKPSAREQASELLTAMRQAIATTHGLKLESVALIKWGSLPKTSSGKVRRADCREAFLAGTLDLVAIEKRLPGPLVAARPEGEA